MGAENTWSAVSCGNYHTVAIKTDGTLWAWGFNGSGQLGFTDPANINTPTQVGTSTWASVSGDGAHTLAIRTDGTLWVWGRNNYGQLAQLPQLG